MARNDPATLHIKGGVHEGVMPTEPYRYLDLPIYHLDTALTPIETRRDKVHFYDTLPGVQVAEDGTGVSATYYLPEQAASSEPVAADPEDLSALRRVARAAAPDDRVLDRASGEDDEEPVHRLGTIRAAEVLAHWPEHPFLPRAYAATITLRPRARTPARDLHQMTAGEVRPLMATVRNDGEEIWRRAGRNGIALASKWFTPAADVGGVPLAEGPRSHFTADVHPGDTFLQPLSVEAPETPGRYKLWIDLVHEQVRWFGCGVAIEVEVTAS
jgi:hypothetical protein